MNNIEIPPFPAQNEQANTNKWISTFVSKFQGMSLQSSFSEILVAPP